MQNKFRNETSDSLYKGVIHSAGAFKNSYKNLFRNGTNNQFYKGLFYFIYKKCFFFCIYIY